MRRTIPIMRLSSLMLAIGMIYVARLASAHAVITESSPSLNATFTGHSVPVDLHFNSRIDKKRSRLAVINPDNTSQPLSFPLDGDANRITATVDGLAPNRYQIEWQVLGIDGHITRGLIPFTVKAP